MRMILAALLAAAVVSGAGCVARSAPPPPAPTAASDAVRVARIVRLMELNRNRVAMELERVALSQRYGENHPQMKTVTSQLAAIDSAIAREFLPEEQAAIAAYDQRALELRLQLQEQLALGRGESHPEVKRVRSQLAAVERMAGEGRETQDEATLLARIQQEPDSPAPQIELALLYMRANRAAEAERALDRAIKLLRQKRL